MMSNFIPNFNEFLNEGKMNESKVAFGKMKFAFSIFYDRQGMALQFIPDSKTLDLPKIEIVEKIQSELNSAMPEFASTLWFESGSNAAGLIFRVDTFKLSDVILKNLK